MSNRNLSWSYKWSYLLYCILLCVYVHVPRPYEVRKIMNTNLILLVVNELCSNSLKSQNFDTVPREVIYEEFNNSLNCHKALNSLPRCRPKTACIKTHPEVSTTVYRQLRKIIIIHTDTMYIYINNCWKSPNSYIFIHAKFLTHKKT